ncbi:MULTISPECIES: SMI1/KNR4 family protein [Calothrix]|uniref:SMI1/KNR4 family protein n=2 Tax=Calothrix TaxID=1186 RepID=A0ABR8A7T0_9CYAN|nr:MULTISPECIES: SMI1/KNR4 family protein [Calothrix]MBD2195914.1 SMI1/KNR4 family protein [Calothrix parietina FACHB-288]MBD2227628.1 SMI1/KNR4 family protein [Calothrix anomala FACHB-343]
MKNFNWQSRIREWSQKRIEALEDYEKEELSSEVIESGYLGYPGATEEQITAAEARLNINLPPSYREFLKASNGLPPTSKGSIRFYAVEEIDWYALNHQDWIDELMEDRQRFEPVTEAEYFVYGHEQCNLTFYPAHLQTVLEISSEDLGFQFLLNPNIIVVDKEWEAWFCSFSTTFGLYRYRSFSEMMDEILNDLELLG